MRNKILITLFLLISTILIILNSTTTHAALLGVNRATLNYQDVLRGGYAEEQITITMGTPNNIQVNFEARGDVADWIRFEIENEQLIVNENNPGILTVIVEPPQDARVDTYEATILITTGALGEVTTQMGTNVVVAFEVKVNINITDTQIISCTAGGINLNTIEINEENTLRANIKNTGNVRIRPQFEIKIYSQMHEQLIKEQTYRYDDEITPTKTQQIQSNINLELDAGQYWAEITEPVCGATQLITFSVLERGAISDEGELLRLRTNTWAETNEIIPITATFKNRGERAVSAQFRGIITKDNRIIKVIESNTLTVPAGDEVNLEMFYETQELGQYQVKGRVHYNNKVTNERGTIINVHAEGDVKTQKLDSITLLFSVIIITMTLLIFLILRKEKKKRKKN